ncbi:multidrug ABC transporter [Parafrankia colletiae]|uniref:Multidrug ABC transporter n=1 Tax=Parafrankia colletiae TaxID=573497 RepID=A0A1S1QV01_9ACTN|nr:MFS transporter [Parafrankia colletiae]MCK9903525.1 MFS transporter [Frankia sp. Cpl3]OHV36882.1 multidrug ABC transporter [Parafrankia colletiae]
MPEQAVRDGANGGGTVMGSTARGSPAQGSLTQNSPTQVAPAQGSPARGSPRQASLTHGSVGRLVAALGAATLLQWSGAFAIAPLLPLYLEDRDVPASSVGIVMAAFFVGSLLSQYPAGVLTAGRGHRPVLVGGLVLYAVGCVGLIVSPGLHADAVVRALQGAGAGAFEVAVLTAVAETVPPGLTGRAVSAVYTGQTAGIAIGPLLGGLAGEQRMDLLFLGAGVAAAVASIPALVLLRPDGHPRALPPPAHDGEPARPPSPPLGTPSSSRASKAPQSGRTSRRLGGLVGPGAIGLLLVAAVNGLAVGTYETCWSLLLADRDVSTELIGLSFTLFALPHIVCAMPAGWLADHSDRRWLVTGATVATGITVASYSFIESFWLIVMVCCAEAIALAISFPSAQSLLVQECGPQGAGRAQGLFTTTQTAATAVAALASGALYSANVHLPFLLTAVAAAVVAGVLPVLWHQVRGVSVASTDVAGFADGAFHRDDIAGVEAAAARGSVGGLTVLRAPVVPAPVPPGVGTYRPAARSRSAGPVREAGAVRWPLRLRPGAKGRYAGQMRGSARSVRTVGGSPRPEEHR